MNNSVNLYYYDYERLKLSFLDNIQTERYTSFQQIDLLKRIMERFGNRVKGAHRDGYVLLNNELSNIGNPFYGLVVTLQKVLGVKCVIEILKENEFEMTSSVNFEKFIFELSEEGLVNIDEFFSTGNQMSLF